MSIPITNQLFCNTSATPLFSSPGDRKLRLNLKVSQDHTVQIAAHTTFVDLIYLIDQLRALFGKPRKWVKIDIVNDKNPRKNSTALLNINSLCQRTFLTRGLILKQSSIEMSTLLSDPRKYAVLPKNFQELFPNACVINHESRTSQLTAFHEHLTAIEQSRFSPCVYPTVNADSLHVHPTLIARMSKSEQAEKEGIDDRPGQLGCLLTYLNILRLAKLQNMPTLLVMSDEARFAPAKFANHYLSKCLIEAPANWGILLFNTADNKTGKDAAANLVEVTQFIATSTLLINSSLYDRLINLFEREIKQTTKKIRCFSQLINEELIKTKCIYATKTPVLVA